MVNIHRLPFRAPHGYFVNAVAVRGILQRLQPDLFHAHYASGYGTLGRLANFHPWILSVWGSDVFDVPFRSPFHRRLIVANVRAADWVCSTSYVMARQVEELCGHCPQLSITPFGIDTARFQPGRRDVNNPHITIGAVKSLRATYGIDTLIRGFARCRELLGRADVALADRLRLQIVGGGPLRRDLEQLTHRLGVQDLTTFAGAVDHAAVPECLRQIDIYVAMSRSESFGVAVIEASACGLPVVVSNVGGLPEVVQADRTGLILEKDDVEGLARALVGLVKNPQQRRQLGQAGRRMVEQKYEWDSCVARMLQVYTRVREQALRAAA